jgi:hypothetical protein
MALAGYDAGVGTVLVSVQLSGPNDTLLSKINCITAERQTPLGGAVILYRTALERGFAKNKITSFTIHAPFVKLFQDVSC